MIIFFGTYLEVETRVQEQFVTLGEKICNDSTLGKVG